MLTMTLFISCGSGDTTDDKNDVDSAGDDTSQLDEINDSDVIEDVDEASDEGVDEVSDEDGGAEECAPENLFWIYDLSVMPPADTQICAHIRGEGENVYVLVADEAWGKSVDDATVANLIKAWDDETPNDADNGIFNQVTSLFGSIPDVFDDDPKIYLFLYEMNAYGGTSFDGYLKGEDLLDIAISNKKEMLHLNTVNKAPDSDYMLSVQAHEFQHLVHWNYDPNEDAWLNEAMSEVAMVLTGFGADDAWVASWASDARKAPLISSSNAYHYGILLLFGTYMYEQFGDQFIADLVADEANGIASVETFLADLDTPIDFRTLFSQFALAAVLDDTEFADGTYGYNLLDVPTVSTFNLNDITSTQVVGNGGTSYLKYTGALTDKTVTFTTDTFADVDYSIVIIGATETELLDQGRMSESPTAIPFGNRSGDETVIVVFSNMSGGNIDVGITFD